MAKRNKKKSSPFLYVLFVIGFLVGAGILFYPTISELWNQYRDQQLVSEYHEAVGALEEEDYSEVLAEARAYNDQHTTNIIVDAFNEETGDYIMSHPYDQLLDPMGNGIMGYLEIPKISVNLPIYHGAGMIALENGVGHIEGTSLPIGGAGTHAVLSGHRGLPSAKMLTDLDQIGIGDIFLIRVLNETMAYRVDQILTVLPTETEAMAIEEDRDMVTLVTCTPYGVNSHRLLVRGERTEYIPEEMDADTGIVLRNPLEGSQNRTQTLLVLALAAFIIFVILLNIVLSIRDRKRKKRQAEQARSERGGENNEKRK
ncbi:MAG: class C sortase [Lachnospiraceae bacterium]|nr:class C sortase [Lachnospiraceae bacterium]